MEEEQFDTEEKLNIDYSDEYNGDDVTELKKIYEQHPECNIDYIEDVYKKLNLGNDKNHTSIPFITLYEKTRIIGIRANQLSQGSKPYVNVPKHVTDIVEIAKMELEQKRIPFIVKRPMPNGTYEYWRVSDLMLL